MLFRWSRKKKAGVVILACAVLIAGGVGMYRIQAGEKEESTVVTKETKVQSGNLTVGVTESGNVSIDALTQTFPLDWSGSSSGSGTSSGGSMASSEDVISVSAGGNSLQGIDGNALQSETSASETQSTASTSESQAAALVVEKVYAAAGQSVEKGDSLLKLTSESIREVRAVYQSCYEEKEAAYEEAQMEYQSGKLTAEYEYKQKLARGDSAGAAYQATLATLASNVSNAKAAYQEAKNGIAKLPAQITSLKKQIRSLKKATGGAVSGTSRTDTQSTVSPAADDALSDSAAGNSSQTLTQLQEQLLQKQEQLKEYQSNLTNLKTSYHAAKKAETTGKIEAKSTYQQAKLDCKNAKAVYQTAVSGLKEEFTQAEEDYTQAKEDLKEFNQYVKGGTVKAEYSGILVSLGYQAGDSLTSGENIATYQDADSVTISVSVAQEDVADIQVGDSVNIYLSAYEDELFYGTVTSISTTSTGDSTVSYPVEVTVTSDVSKIYSGMSGEVTFVSKEVTDVLYVSNKAITTEGTNSYVTRKKEDGSTQKMKVTTGFSDGHNVEIKSGLEEGEIVLIESQVSQ